jgi:cholinesterase
MKSTYRMFYIGVALPLLQILAIANTSNAIIVQQPIATTSGKVTGQISALNPGVIEYLGIRFGETTAGNNRFMPPKRYSGSSPIQTTKFSYACPEGFGSGISGLMGSRALGVQPSNEDCLFLNIWANSLSLDRNRPVMLWIYGGAFATGDGSLKIANGAKLAKDHDMIVVSPNYRVAMFGFPGTSELEHKNPGLLDQRLAVKWVRDNIAAFGGDPERFADMFYVFLLKC